MSMLVQQAKHKLPALLGTQGKLSVAFSPSTAPSTPNHFHSSEVPINGSHLDSSPLNPKPPIPPKPTSIPQQESNQSIPSEQQQTSIPQQNILPQSTSPSPSLSFESDNNISTSLPVSQPKQPSSYRAERSAHYNHKRPVSNERIYHGRSFDSRVEALKHLLTPTHFASLFRSPKTTSTQAARLLAQALEFRVSENIVFHSYLGYFSRRGNVAEVLRTIEQMRERGIAYSERERMHIARAHRRAQSQGDAALRDDVIRAWVILRNAEMCLRCYESMRASGWHPGFAGYTALLRLFSERGESDVSSRLIEDMDILRVQDYASSVGGKPMQQQGIKLDLETFKSMLRYHSGLAERDVCETILEEMRNHNISEDEEIRSIMDKIEERENEQELDSAQDDIKERPMTKERKSKPQFSNSSINTDIHNNNLPQVNIHTCTPIPIPTTPTTPTTPTSTSTSASTSPNSTTNINPSPVNPPSNSYIPDPLQPNPYNLTIKPTSPKTELETGMKQLEIMETNGEVLSSEVYHSLLQLAARAGDGEACEKLLATMDATGIERTEQTYAYMIEAMKDNLQRCEDLFITMRARGLTPTRATQNAMLWIFCAQRRVADAFALFEDMKRLGTCDTAAYNTLMRVYAADDNLQSVMGLSADMKTCGIAHDIATYTVMVEMLGRFGLKGVLVVDAVVREMQQNDIQMDVVMYDALMDIYGGAGYWDKCSKLWEEMGRREVVLGAGSCARFLEKHCRRDPNLYVKWKKEFSSFLPP